MSTSPDVRAAGAPIPSGPTTAPRRSLRGVIGALVAFALLGSLAVGAQAQEVPPTTDPAEAAAGWLARQLTDGERLQGSFEDVETGDTVVFDDTGLTIDAVLAFAAAGVADDAGASAMAWIGRSDVLSGYIGDGTDTAWAGGTAKVALTALVRGQDPRAFGEDGTDLIDRLESLEEPSGRFSDVSDFGDFSNTFTQALAVLALHRAPGVDPSAAAVDLLRASQCPTGGFTEELEPEGDCAGQVDATAFAVQALLAVDADGAEAALDWLISQQGTDGDVGANANSTGLAAQALAAGGRDGAAAAARTFLLGLQAGCDAAEDQRGAVAFDAEGLDETALRATPQATLGLAGVGLAALDATGAASAAPALACADAPAAPTEPVAGPAPAAPATAPAATPVAPVAQATPTYAG
jgi:hypothetical protein